MIWHKIYSTSSSRDIGTLYAARNTINARNVSADPAGNYYASEVMADKFTDAYIVAGALEHFNMDSFTDEPKAHIYNGPIGHKEEMATYILAEAKDFVDSFVCIDVNPLPSYGPENNTFACHYCGKIYARSLGLRKHEHKAHGHHDPKYDANVDIHVNTSESNTPNDMILNYTKLTMTYAAVQSQRCHIDGRR